MPQGTGAGLYGYHWNKETKRREIIEDEAEVVRAVFRRVADGQAIISISRSLNEARTPTKGSKAGDPEPKLWHSLTIRRMVKNPGYIGKTRFKDVVLREVTPAIISQEVFDMANNQLHKPQARTGRPEHPYLLRGHVFCALCGSALVGHCLDNAVAERFFRTLKTESLLNW